MGQNRQKLPCPKSRNFLLLRGHRFGQKIEFTVMAPNHGGDPLGYILRPMRSHWGQKMGQNRKKLPCHKIRIFDYSAVIDFGPKMDPRGSPPWFGTITVNSIFCPNRWPRSSEKFEYWGMVIFNGFDPFFGPNGTPLAPRWTLGVPHRDLAP